MMHWTKIATDTTPHHAWLGEHIHARSSAQHARGYYGNTKKCPRDDVSEEAGEPPKPPKSQRKTKTKPEKNTSEAPPRPTRPRGRKNAEKRPKAKKTQAENHERQAKNKPQARNAKRTQRRRDKTQRITDTKILSSSDHPPAVTRRVCTCACTRRTRRQAGCKRIS